MDQARYTLPYHDGYLALTDTHLVVVHRQVVTEYLAFAHLSDAVGEQAHSFRHRILGMMAAVLLLVPSIAALVAAAGAGNPGIPVMWWSKLGIGALFSTFFGLLFLWGVCRSRWIWWLRVRYATATKNIPLPGVDEGELERFLEAIHVCREEPRTQ